MFEINVIREHAFGKNLQNSAKETMVNKSLTDWADRLSIRLYPRLQGPQDVFGLSEVPRYALILKNL